MAVNDTVKLQLHSYFRSSCSARLRIALNLKNLEYDVTTVDLLRGEHQTPAYVDLNPSKAVPLLTITEDPVERSMTLSQSMAILEYLEERFSDSTPLLPSPSDTAGRARVRALANLIASDVQPVTNLQILRAVDNLGGDKALWAKEFMTRGLEAFETQASKVAGRYTLGDNITMADVCLVPAVWGAQRFGVDMSRLPTVQRVFGNLEGQQAVMKAHWKCQPDTPKELRY